MLVPNLNTLNFRWYFLDVFPETPLDVIQLLAPLTLVSFIRAILLSIEKLDWSRIFHETFSWSELVFMLSVIQTGKVYYCIDFYLDL